MIETDLISAETRRALNRVGQDLHARFHGVFGKETVESLVVDSYLKLAVNARVTTWLVVGTERLTRDRLEALVRSTQPSARAVPAVLFLCTHNAGRSQMARGWFRHLAGDRAVAWSAGSEPASEINPAAVAAMAEVGIDISKGFPKPWTHEVVAAADVVVTMGCGDACPLVPGKRYEDWEVDDPAGLTIEQVRPIRDQIAHRVHELLSRLEIPVSTPSR